MKMKTFRIQKHRCTKGRKKEKVTKSRKWQQHKGKRGIKRNLINKNVGEIRKRTYRGELVGASRREKR